VTIWDWLISVPLAVAGVAISIYYGRLGLRAKKNQLSWRWEAVPLLHASSTELSSSISVQVGGEKVASPHLVRLNIKNLGKSDIASSNFDKSGPLSFRVDRKVLWVQSSRSEVGLNGHRLEVGPLLLRSGESVSSSLLCDGPPHVSIAESPLIDTILTAERAKETNERFGREKRFKAVAAAAAALAAGYVGVVVTGALTGSSLAGVQVIPVVSAINSDAGEQQKSVAFTWRSVNSSGDAIGSSGCRVHAELRSSSNAVVESTESDQCSLSSPIVWPINTGVYSVLVTVQIGDRAVSDYQPVPFS
jgi:hypothetical protein